MGLSLYAPPTVVSLISCDIFWIVGSHISVLEMEVLQKFGRRVRYLSFCLGDYGEGAIVLHPSVPIILANSLAGEPLLPNLQHLSFSVNYMRENYPSSGLLHILHSTNIRTVHLWHEIEDVDAVVGFYDFSSFISRLSQAPLLHESGISYRAKLRNRRSSRSGAFQY